MHTILITVRFLGGGGQVFKTNVS